MKKLIQLLRFPDVKPLLVMNYVFEEATQAFMDYGCEISIVYQLSHLKNEGIIFIDNGAYKQNIIEQINKICPDAVYVTWYFRDENYKPFKYMLRLGNHMLKYPSREILKQEFDNYTKLTDYCPFKFRANEDPNLVGTYKRSNKMDYCYMGCEYRREWVPFELNGLYKVGGWQDYLSYDKRKEIYLSSTFALGFHHDEPIDCGSISQRVFEGLAYGCIVLCDNPIAEILTDGIVVTVFSKEDVLQKIAYYKNHPDLVTEKQNQGYTWVKKYGTNRETIKTILEKIKQLYNFDFTN